MVNPLFDLKRRRPAFFAGLLFLSQFLPSPAAAAIELGMNACSPATGTCPLIDLINRMVQENIGIYVNFRTSVFPTLCGTGADDNAKLANYYDSGGASIKALIDYARGKGLEIAYGLDFQPQRTAVVGDVTTFDDGVCSGASGGAPLIPLADRRLGSANANQILIKEALKKEVEYIASEIRPKYLAFGIELDSYLRDATSGELTELWAAFDEIKTAAKAAAAAAGNPEMLFFAYFQYENVENNNLWPLVTANKDKSDLYVFSSYPTIRSPLTAAFPAGTGGSFPADYYDSIIDHMGTGKSVAFFELGQPHANTTNNPYSIAGDGPADQNAWMTAFFQSIDGMDVRFINYISAYDTMFSLVYNGNNFFDKMGLRSDADVAYPAWTTFVEQAPKAIQTVQPSSDATLLLSAPSGPIRLDIPAHSFSTAVTITLQSTSPNSTNASFANPVAGLGIAALVTLDPAGQPNRPLTITIGYQDSNVTNVNENHLLIARFDDSRSAWVPLVSAPDPANNRVSADIDHLSVFQLMVTVPAGSLSDIKAFPNPFRPSKGHTAITFTGLPSGVRVRIHTLLGERVREIRANDAGLASWDGKNSSGEDVASGIYFALVEGAGGKKTIKVAVQR